MSSSLFFSFQDWVGAASGNISGDAYFDNIVITNISEASNVPEPSTLAVFAFCMIAFATRRFQNNIG